MAKPERPTLNGLEFRKKPAPVMESSASDAAPRVTPAPAQGETDGKVPVMVRMTRADRKLIRQIAIGMDTSVQRLLEEAINDIIRRHRGSLNL